MISLTFAHEPARHVLLAAVLIFMGLAAGCGTRESQVEQATREQIMIVGNGAEPASLDPHLLTGEPENTIVETLFEGLTRLDPESLEPLPGVAERWEVSDDGLVYTFHLRPEAQWSDGTPLTARDFIASFKRILSPTLASENADFLYFVVNARDYHEGRLTDFDQVGFRLIDDRTLEISLRHPTPFLLKTMASRPWYPVPLHIIEALGDPLRPGNPWTRAEHLVGNGPFELHAWEPDRHLEVRKSLTYWNADAVRLNGVRFIPTENQAAEEAAFRAGQLHKTNKVPLSKVAVYRQEAPELLHIHPYSGVYYFNFNVQQEPFDDVRVRRALAMAVDRESIVRNITQAGEIPAYHFTPEGIGGYVSRARTSLDFDGARRLLAEAGYPEGRGFPVVTLLYNTAENHRIIAEAVQQTWRRELGIDIRLENQEWKVYLDNMHNQFYQICRAGLIMEPFDPSQFLRVFTSSSGFNSTGWSDPEYDRLYEQVMHTADEAVRLELMQQMERILTDAMPILPVYYYTNSYLMSPAVKGWADNLLALGPFNRAWLE